MSDPPKYHELVEDDSARPASLREQDGEDDDEVVDGMPLLFRDGALQIAMEEPIESWCARLFSSRAFYSAGPSALVLAFCHFNPANSSPRPLQRAEKHTAGPSLSSQRLAPSVHAQCARDDLMQQSDDTIHCAAQQFHITHMRCTCRDRHTCMRCSALCQAYGLC